MNSKSFYDFSFDLFFKKTLSFSQHNFLSENFDKTISPSKMSKPFSKSLIDLDLNII